MLEIPYSLPDFSMIVLLPKDKSDNLGCCPEEVYLKLLEELKSCNVQVYLPEFHIESSLNMNNYVMGLGIRDAFSSETANFCNMSNAQLSVSIFRQDIIMDVNKNGTHAAAVSVVIMDGDTPIAGEPILFKADHPFMFAIRDEQTGAVPFMGVAGR